MADPSPRDPIDQATSRPVEIGAEDDAAELARRDEMVLTPGGYRPRSQVRKVGPDEAIHVAEDGSHAIVPREKSGSE